MKHVVVSALVAAAISGIALTLFPRQTGVDENAQNASPAATTTAAAAQAAAVFSISDALPEDVWLDGSRQSGDDHRILTNADTSVCFITKIDVRGIASANDQYACNMQIDDFTGFWDLVVSVAEDSQANVRCNARCLVWE